MALINPEVPKDGSGLAGAAHPVDPDEGLTVMELLVLLIVLVSAALVAADAFRLGVGRGW